MSGWKEESHSSFSVKHILSKKVVGASKRNIERIWIDEDDDDDDDDDGGGGGGDGGGGGGDGGGGGGGGGDCDAIYEFMTMNFGEYSKLVHMLRQQGIPLARRRR